MAFRSVSRNPAAILFLLTLGALGVLIVTGSRLPISKDDAVRHEIRLRAASQDIDRRAAAALKDGDLPRARSYADLARYMGWPSPPAMPNELDSARTSHVISAGPVADDAMARELGSKTQAIAELTGKHSLDAFDTSLRTFDFIVDHIVGFGAWMLALFGLAVGQRIVPALHT